MTIQAAVTRLQDLVAACSTVVFRSAKDYPVENVEPFPLSVAYVSGGSFHMTNATQLLNFPVITLELHFSRTNIKQVNEQIDAIASELPKRLAKDPTLNGSVVTIIAGQDSPITYERRPFQWTPQGTTPVVISEMLRFDIPVKLLETPQA